MSCLEAQFRVRSRGEMSIEREQKRYIINAVRPNGDNSQNPVAILHRDTMVASTSSDGTSH